MKITTRYFDDEVFNSENENGNTITVDMRNAEEKSSFSPVEMVLSALSSCVAVEVVSMIKKRRKTLADLIVTTDAKRRETHPRAITEATLHFILVSPDANDDELYKIIKLALENYCSVGSSLKAIVSFTSRVERP